MRSGPTWLLVLLAALLVVPGCGSSSRPTDGDEICDNGEDDDDDGDIDCDDTDCRDDPACEGEVEDCDNGRDDDDDGDADCEDSDCRDDPACEGEVEDCDNGRDDDDDGDTDCDDSDCRGDPACEGEVEICDNDEDDDGDGDVDCDDSDCRTDPACEGEVEICDNGTDDDGDGLTDCEDTECEGDPACVEDCDNGLDDDGDGDADCLDGDCADDPFCLEICDDGLDNDHDGETDCGDEDCAEDPYCSEDCDNGVDDDDDGLVDCMDDSCDFDAACPELCNGVDDDGDGRVDEHPIEPSIGDPCYEGDPELAGIGQCVYGAIECFGGDLLCIGWVAPLDEELCDGLDNDCDGTVPPEEATEGCGTSVTPGDPTSLEFATEVRDVDVHVNLDTTGSMSGELATLRSALGTTIVPEVRAVLPTSAFGVSTFDDFPFSPFGSEPAGDMPFILRERVTTNVAAVQAAIDAASIHNGADGPESGIESLYQIATGDGVFWASDWSAEDCRNGRDDDGDGDADCDDVDCDLVGWCWRVDEDCSNGVDDDGDGYVDCNDPNCIVYGVDPACSLVPGTCGNGVINSTEQCDDGGTTSGDGCSATCRIESGCGNALLGASGMTTEECDDGNTDDGDGCDGTCHIEADVCGNGAVGPLEQCDDGGTTPGDGCDATCRIEGTCGDGVTAATEECDDGDTVDGDGCGATCLADREGVPAFDWAVGYDAGLGHGAVGGVGFRTTALPVIVHITDNVSHDAADYLSAGLDAHSAVDTYAALAAIGARVVGVWSGFDTGSTDPANPLYPLGMAVGTGAVVPICAFDGSAPRTSGACAADQCCTGEGGAGVAPVDGECPLYFDVRGDGSGLDTSIVTAIDALSRFVTYDLTLAPRDDPADGVDAMCFVEAIGVASFTAPPGSCGATPVGVDTDGDGTLDTVQDASPRTNATFTISVVNADINDVDGDGDTTEACATRGSYGLYLDVLADGSTVVSTRRVTVEIP